MSDLRQCGCGEIDRHYAIQLVWDGHGPYKIGVVFCAQCGDVEPFKFDCWQDEQQGAEVAKSAWNAGPSR